MLWKMSGCAWRGALLFLLSDAQSASRSHSRLPNNDFSHSFTARGRGRWLPIFADVFGILFAGRRTARRGIGKLSRIETIATLSSVGWQRI